MKDEPTGNGKDAAGTSRRAFLRAGAAAGAGLVTGAGIARAAETPDPLITEVQPWATEFGEAVDAHPYGLPIHFESHVKRQYVEWLTESPVSSINFTPIHALEGTITPQGCAFERHHSGAIELSKQDYRLMINGLVEKPLVFTFEDLLRFPRATTTAFCECAANGGMEWGGAQLEGCQYTQGMIHNMEYVGVPLSVLLAEAGVKPEGKWLYVEGADASSNGRSLPMEKAMDDVMLAFFANGEALRKEHGYPARLVVPGWEGNMWVKWVRRLGVYDQAVESREETSKYTDLMPDGRARKWTWVMDAKSVITSPSPQVPIRHGKGPLVISGLAWSGNGRVNRVDVSLDGGRNWTTARITGDARPKALTRFHLDIDWDGSEMLLQSRAVDETGYVQPTKDALRAIRGRNNVYHNNAIQTWWVKADGEVENVEVA
ncbi:sulfite dehydrogenase [Paracoccus denitrificans]|jgi:sulfane dehydrogenase subunit SoxC|uniref:Sulfur dehydrogenase subunit SoxC n=1 Tax=Paracoccus denitrificans (strain Pd 1222) TaxID=318586 RepID=A1B9M5_PARDP|nr:sulfite dehydrogenase [Paracoccus denitrificans]ABL72219.1 sulfur dehydrogenase subunit SoxC [Paracoccus denitrificans PD1222]MBB4625862.1 sulfane dehydrogenase subunit SoxC [Paracoccus denitrificans]MCU7426974.1 sulfite dehydrogenase [Paracoccus denitrificans]QAR28792.1 sulfite dehydrogenase [Paracoccus denitrificans]UPV96939.1 sulfite dehydrogenase [Paracoccus denitrificans]